MTEDGTKTTRNTTQKSRRCKVLFVLRSTEHYPYVASIIESLHCDIEIIYDKNWSKKEAQWLVPRTDVWRRLIFPLRELRTYLNYKDRSDQSPYYKDRWKSYLPKYLPKWQLPDIEKLVPPDKGVIKDLIRRKPDVVVVTPANHRFSEEVEYLKAAKALGIPTVVPVLSWDNLTTKGLFHIIPDRLLVWSREQLREAAEIHAIPRSRIKITGAPFFDKWRDCDLDEDYGTFCERVGLDPSMNFFLYLGSSAKIAPNEAWIAQKTADSTFIPMLVRPHPANIEPFKDFKGGVVMETGLEDNKNLHNALRHCRYAIGVNTSAMIDAIVHNKPCYTVDTNAYRSTQSDTLHFKQIAPALGNDEGKRKAFIRNYIWPLDISAGEAAAREIRGMCEG